MDAEEGKNESAKLLGIYRLSEIGDEERLFKGTKWKKDKNYDILDHIYAERREVGV